jgi:pyruvate kinase
MDVAARDLFGRASGTLGRAVAEAAVLAAEELRRRLIVVISHSGNMGRRVAALRPAQRVIALTQNEQTRRQLAVTWGIEPYLLGASGSTNDGLLPVADRALLAHKLAERGENVVIMAGRVPDPVMSLSMKIHCVGEMG